MCRKWNLKAIDRIKYVFKIWLNRSKKGSIVGVQLGSKYTSVNINLLGFTLKKLNPNSACKDKSCNSPESLQPYLKKTIPKVNKPNVNIPKVLGIGFL